jgi:hypothetical protein
MMKAGPHHRKWWCTAASAVFAAKPKQSATSAAQPCKYCCAGCDGCAVRN